MFAKKILFLLTVFTLSIFSFSCSSDQKESEPKTETDLRSEILNKLDLSEFPHIKASTAIQTGYYEIWTTENHELALLKEEKENPILRILQSDDSFGEIPTLPGGQYEVLDLEGILILKNEKTNQLAFIYVENEFSNPLIEKIKALNINFSTEVEGYGLIKHDLKSSEIKIEKDFLKSEKSIVQALSVAYHEFGRHLKQQKTSCPEGSSGGQGSNSCSNANCSVTCGSSYYACCEETCYCYPVFTPSDPPGGQA